MNTSVRNWSGNIAYGEASLHTPRRLEELQEIVRAAPKARALGTRHSFNAIAATEGALLSLAHLNRVLAIDEAARTITVEGGATYRDIVPALDAAGFALANLASLPHVTIAGACATGTHGSGNANPGLAAAVAGVTLVTASGELVTLDRRDPRFPGVPVNLGALGIVSAITLDIVPAYLARQEVYLGLPFTAFWQDFDSIMGAGYSVSAFSRWRGDTIDQLWVKSRGDAPALPDKLAGAPRSARAVPLIPDPANTAPGELMGDLHPWHSRLPHYPIDAEIPAGAELQTEYFVARADAPAALRALHAISSRFAPLLQIAEIRTVAADDLWLSPTTGRDSVALHFAWHPDWPAVRAVLPEIEAALAPFAPRPHWGKLFTLPAAAVQAAYPCLAAFRALAADLDPAGKFRNGFLDPLVFGPPAGNGG